MNANAEENGHGGTNVYTIINIEDMSCQCFIISMSYCQKSYILESCLSMNIAISLLLKKTTFGWQLLLQR